MRAGSRPDAAVRRRSHGVIAMQEWVQRPIAVSTRGCEARSRMGESRREIVSHDALMRWEWEGGAPATVTDRDEAGHAEPGKNPPTRPRRLLDGPPARTSTDDGLAATVGEPPGR
jgi:hypothetical protein